MTDECKYDEMIESYIEGELSDEQKREFEQHLIGCDDCREQVEVARKLESTMQRVAAKMERLHQRIEEKVRGIDEKIARKMEKVQERIERKTGAIDERMAARMEKLRQKMEARAARVDQNDSRDVAEFGREMEEFSRAMDGFGREMDEFGREMGEYGSEMDEFGREMDEYGSEMDEFGREMEEFSREMEAEAPKWLAYSVMQKMHATERNQAEPKRNWLLWLGSVMFGVGAVALCGLVIFSGVGAWLGDTIAAASPQVQNGILGNQTLLIGLALVPFGYGLFRVGQAMGYI
jgi:hypothetical protein